MQATYTKCYAFIYNLTQNERHVCCHYCKCYLFSEFRMSEWFWTKLFIEFGVGIGVRSWRRDIYSSACWQYSPHCAPLEQRINTALCRCMYETCVTRVVMSADRLCLTPSDGEVALKHERIQGYHYFTLPLFKHVTFWSFWGYCIMTKSSFLFLKFWVKPWRTYMRTYIRTLRCRMAWCRDAPE